MRRRLPVAGTAGSIQEAADADPYVESPLNRVPFPPDGHQTAKASAGTSLRDGAESSLWRFGLRISFYWSSSRRMSWIIVIIHDIDLHIALLAHVGSYSGAPIACSCGSFGLLLQPYRASVGGFVGGQP